MGMPGHIYQAMRKDPDRSSIEVEEQIAAKTAVLTIVMDTMKVGDKFVEDKTRSKLTRETLLQLRARGYTTYAVYSDNCTPDTKKSIKDNSFAILEQGRGMGPLFLQGLKEIMKTSKEYEAVVWMEVEKLPLVPQISEFVVPLLDGQADFVIPARKEMFGTPPLESYPTFQAYEEMAGNAYFNKVVHGRRLDLKYETERWLFYDVYFGPDGWKLKDMSQFFLDYENVQFPNKPNQWDVHMLPQMSMIRKGKRVASVPVDYIHPGIQTAAEESMEAYQMWCGKRINQLTTLTNAITEYKKLLDDGKI